MMTLPNGRQEILIVGTGYVGLVTAVGLAKLGHTVNCHDVDAAKIERLQGGRVPFFEPGLAELLSEVIASGRISFFSDYEKAYAGQRYVIVAVPTPMNHDGDADLSILNDCVDRVCRSLTNDTLLIVKSTVPVGIFDDLSGREAVRRCGDKVELVSCPEFLAEGSAVHDFFNPKRTVVGSDSGDTSAEVASLFHGVGGQAISTDAKTAQMIKYSANSFLATRVAFINEIARLCQGLNINVADVSRALSMDPRAGTGYLNAGVGFAGPCLPKDISALVATGKRLDCPTGLLSAVSHQNKRHLKHVISDIGRLTLEGDTVSVFGLSFKPNTDDVRNSFALQIIGELAEEYGLNIKATDPQSIEGARVFFQGDNRVSFDADPYETAAGTTLQVFLTPWSTYQDIDLGKLASRVARPRMFDATGIFSPTAAAEAGFDYHGIGREFGTKGAPVFHLQDAVPRHPMH